MRLLTGILFAILAMGCALEKAPFQGMSEEMSQFVGSVSVDKYDLDVSKFPKASETEFLAIEKKPGVEVYKVPRRKGAVDTFTYTVYLDKSQKEFWVSRAGGFAGVFEFYGPIKSTF